tara:strand:+ start:3437 stop:5422 length:1986 start_codon:yes stop_codon:yes gene_type:complete
MDSEEILLQVTLQFLETAEGKALLENLGNKIDFESITQRISDLDRGLDSEERKELRANNKKERIKKREINNKKRREKIQSLRAQLKSNIPVLKEFQIKGRVFDKNTNDGIPKISVKAIEAFIDRGSEEERNQFKKDKQKSRKEIKDLRGNNNEVKKLRAGAKIENQENKKLRAEVKNLNNTLDLETVISRGKGILNKTSNENDFNINPNIRYSGGKNSFFSFNEKQYTPSTPKEEILSLPSEANPFAYRGKYYLVEKSVASKKLEDYLSNRKQNIANERVSRFETDEKGNFDLKLKVAVLPSIVTITIKNPKTGKEEKKEVKIRDNDIVILNPKLLYAKRGYAPTTQEIKNLDNSIKSDLITISLVNIDIAVDEAINEVNNEIDNAKSKINRLYLSTPEKVLVARRKQIMNVVNIIKGKLIPLAIGLLIAFGITKLTQKELKVCPTPDVLRDNIKRRNRVVKQLNQIYIALAINTTLAAVFSIIALKLKELKLTIDNLPFPVAVPPGVGVPYSVIGNLQSVSDFIKELEKQNKDLNKQIIIALIFLVAALIAIVLLLKGIDQLTEECANNEDLEYESISQELLDLTEETAAEGTPVLTNVNGFAMKVVTVDGVGQLKRRRAVAKNKQGVIQLKGEPSFSSSDQILIDELAFYITSNNLKAF